jgi:dihydropteroate synthase
MKFQSPIPVQNRKLPPFQYVNQNRNGTLGVHNGENEMPRYLFVTGKLAAQSLHDCLKGIQTLEYEVAVLPISVAALMDAQFITKHLAGTGGCDRIMIPGLCGGDPALIEQKTGVEVIRGPDSLKDVPGYFGSSRSLEGYGEHHVKIVAEIVDAHRLTLEEILNRAAYYRSSGADIIDLGGPVSGSFPGIEVVVRSLKLAGFLVSIDSFNTDDILMADNAGVDFVLSVNSRNIDVARRLRSKVVVIPDEEQGVESLDLNIEKLETWRVPYIIDPILKPIGFGFTESIEHFAQVRRKYPKSEILLGAGNITELTEADTTGINALMAGVIAELGIDYVLTTEVASWTRGAVRELDYARRLMHYAQKNRVLPKHIHSGLLTIKDPHFETFGEEELRAMQAKIKDRHFRIFADRQFIYVLNKAIFIKGTDADSVFAELGEVDANHAFYLGRELQKASIAIKLGKRYAQEKDLRWGYLSENTENTEENGKH